MQSFKNYLHAVREGDSKPARTTIKGLSVFTGGFLIIAGFFGLSMIIQGDLLYVVGSIYAIIFGLLVLVVEIKDRTPIITRAYQWIDTYLKFLTLQRGKGTFYCGVGLLVFFIGTGDGGWGLNHVAALLLALVGLIHAFKAIKEVNTQSSDIATAFPPVEAKVDVSASTWNDLRAQAEAEEQLRT